jgi:hypothetical protein
LRAFLAACGARGLRKRPDGQITAVVHQFSGGRHSLCASFRGAPTGPRKARSDDRLRAEPRTHNHGPACFGRRGDALTTQLLPVVMDSGPARCASRNDEPPDGPCHARHTGARSEPGIHRHGWQPGRAAAASRKPRFSAQCFLAQCFWPTMFSAHPARRADWSRRRNPPSWRPRRRIAIRPTDLISARPNYRARLWQGNRYWEHPEPGP